MGLKVTYKIQETPRGLADAFIIGEEFIGDDSVCLILGDNIFYGQDLTRLLNRAKELEKGATIFGYPVKDARAFGVVEFDKNNKVVSVEEKPKYPKSNYAIPGFYFYDNEVVQIAKNIKPSDRGEIEITAVNNAYLEKNKLNVILLGHGMACLEEIAWRRGFISKEQLREIGERLKMTD